MGFLVPRRENKQGVNLWDDFFDLEKAFNLPSAFSGGSVTPALDIEADADSVTVRAEIAGVNKEDISVDYHDGILTISGEKKSQTREGNESRVYREISVGKFSRTVSVGEVDFDNAKADYKDGLLTIQLPKVEHKKRKTLEIQ